LTDRIRAESANLVSETRSCAAHRFWSRATPCNRNCDFSSCLGAHLRVFSPSSHFASWLLFSASVFISVISGEVLVVALLTCASTQTISRTRLFSGTFGRILTG